MDTKLWYPVVEAVVAPLMTPLLFLFGMLIMMFYVARPESP